jgi:hypothetical protein
MALITGSWTTATTEDPPSECKQCGANFDPRPWGKKTKVFCSRKCMTSWKNTAIFREKTGQNWDGQTREIECVRCGCVFESSLRQNERRVFCSAPCAWRAGNSALYFRKKATDPLHNRRKTFAKHGLSLEDYERILSAQGGRCAICRSERIDLRIDHDHVGGRVRGILCNGCNTGIGMFSENIDALANAIAYLLEANKWR